jgi:hypothetical protein
MDPYPTQGSSLVQGAAPDTLPKPPDPTGEATVEAAPTDPCTCGFCDGVKIRVETVDPRTGQAADQSFTRMSRRPRCPICGGVNVQYRRSYVAHVAALVRRLNARRCDVYALSVTLDTEAARAADLDTSGSYRVWTGTGGPWSRARRAIRRRDPDAVYVGTLSARQSDGQYHFHGVVVSESLDVADLREAAHVAGLDVYVQQPAATESAEHFGARKAGYAYENAARPADGPPRFVSSRGHGEGYDSEEAKRRRREAVERRQETELDDQATGDPHVQPGDPRARGHSRNQPRRRDAADADDGRAEGREGSETGVRGPPIRCEGTVHPSREAYDAAVSRRLRRHVGRSVHVEGVGRAKLLCVHGLGSLTVHVDGETTTRTVEWQDLAAENVPRVRVAPQPPTNNRRSIMSRPDQHDADDPVQRFNEAAETSRVTVELRDGRRRVTIKNHRTGETRQKTLPPRDRA